MISGTFGLMTPLLSVSKSPSSLVGTLSTLYKGLAVDKELEDFIAGHDTPANPRSHNMYESYSMMEPITLLTRSVFSPSFTYYSPSTGTLDREQYERLLRKVDRGVSGWRRWRRGHQFGSSGWVGGEVRYKGSATYNLGFGGKDLEEIGPIRSDWELDLVR